MLQYHRLSEYQPANQPDLLMVAVKLGHQIDSPNRDLEVVEGVLEVHLAQEVEVGEEVVHCC